MLIVVRTSENWISEMTSHFSFKKTIVLGYGAYDKIKGSFLNKIIRYETVLTAIQYFSWAKIGKPYMGVGRNLAYKKSEFFGVNGFINHIRVRSGDDDLFINEAANSKSNTAICYNLEGFTYSEPKTTYKDWFNQKRRHVSTAKHYKGFDKFQLALLFYFSDTLYYFGNNFVIFPIQLDYCSKRFRFQIYFQLDCFRLWSGKIKRKRRYCLVSNF